MESGSLCFLRVGVSRRAAGPQEGLRSKQGWGPREGCGVPGRAGVSMSLH